MLNSRVKENICCNEKWVRKLSERRDVLMKSQMVSVLFMWKKEEQFPVRKSSMGKRGRIQKQGEFQKSEVVLHGQKGKDAKRGNKQ